MSEQLDKIYNPGEVEDRLYAEWVEKGYFTPSPDPDKEPFTIVIPPPNVTGQLHMGHAMDETLQDILIRYKRMAGYAALWVPGTDHAGIATQIKVEEALRKEEGLTRYDLGREAFTERVWDWKHQYGTRIINQLKKLGSSCDWTRERFTMDENLSKAVREVFVSLYEKGLIYQGERIINWCPSCITALSDAEVEYAEQEGSFWHIRYPVKDSDESFVIATTRPETLLGDTAVAVHPDDERYAHLVGKMLILPLVGREIPVVADEYVDKEFGTGAVKITPAHDPNDFEVGARHNLPIIKVLDDSAKINANGGKYEGLDRYEARRQIVKDLEDGGYLVKVEAHAHNVGQCYRCGTTVEPITSKQWFVKMGPLAEKALEVVKDGTIKFVPDRFSKTYINWMENVHDWCISRQLWWGHRIPAFYCDACGETIVSRENVTKCPKCGGAVRQDEDVLDTWFSSALWPFSTLGWPEKTADLDYFYPTSVLVTGYDIIFFWVARMIFSAMEHMGKEPFKHVLIHGLVRDSQGRKMSKSLGNGVDPLEVIKKYGADALRFTLVTGNSPGNDTRYSDERVEASRNFANKIWNASRFVLMNLTVSDRKLPEASEMKLEDKWILHRYNQVVQAVTDNLDRFELGIAVNKLYDFIWDEFCDWYIELIKPRLYDEDCPSNRAAQYTLSYVLSGALELLHPFMPFITEEIWQKLPHEGESIVITEWPKYNQALDFAKEAADMEAIMAALKAIRNQRSEMNIPPSKKATVYIKTEKADVFAQGTGFFEKLAGAQQAIVVGEDFVAPANAVSCVVDGAQLFMPLDDLVDKEKELARLNKEKETLLSEIKRVEGKLSNPGFVGKAPAQVVEEERKKEAKYREMLEKVLENIQMYE
ncbi:MAG: valine--tRNA ligase [Ruminococcaceae bacterium]|nr:valine--tRNA ligase [Oscillospiraceae bacterium]